MGKKGKPWRYEQRQRQKLIRKANRKTDPKRGFHSRKHFVEKYKLLYGRYPNGYPSYAGVYRLEDDIRAGKYPVLHKESNTRYHYKVVFEGKVMTVVFNKKLSALCTILIGGEEWDELKSLDRIESM